MTGREDAERGGLIPARDLLEPAGPAGPVKVPAGEKRDESNATERDGPKERSNEAQDAGEVPFEMGGEPWLAKVQGAGSYGTGRLGSARLLAVHFFRGAAPDVPVREALVPAGVFLTLGAAELSELFERATPIEQ